MRALRFHEYGDPADVLRLEDVPVPDPTPGTIRIEVLASGVAPADWALCSGLFAGSLPRGIGCDAAGVVTAVGEGVTGTGVGDRVFGTTDWQHSTSAGAAQQALMNRWFAMPEGLDPAVAAALPMTVDTAHAHLEWLGLEPGRTILVHGAGSTIGFAAVQMALEHGMTVLATAGDTHADRLRAMGATVTSYGDGMADRVLEANGGPVDEALDAAPVGGRLPELLQAAGGVKQAVMTVSDFEAASALGVRSTMTEDLTRRTDVLARYAQRAAEGAFEVPIAATHPLSQWRTVLDTSRSGHAHGKLVLLPQQD